MKTKPRSWQAADQPTQGPLYPPPIPDVIAFGSLPLVLLLFCFSDANEN